ncbi:hypothetical protein DR094_00925 [Mycoplasma flocculare]|uniref:Uncharacterized protein n=1 Tax=Mesomycoplasma flocculare TaxID=2128 RepID=A0AAW9XAQ7_MESFC|nr:hypothetical protein [Mesomycoplasma flocculare]MXR12034.1 hypothetical protein [Mesomycoplasma flocculare]MXR13294.1 hypothetical protein [Mesomycoplasma flocculare]MXR39250.1 hypothetical protein [Mycoplasma sp. MF12]MXR56560.1 hypothetical protein [Mesomycoplasma flocculare]
MKQILYLYLKLFFAISIILTFVGIWDYTLVLGWFFSLISVLISMFLKFLFLAKVIKNVKRKTKTTVFIVFFVHILLILLQGLILTSIYFINKTFQNINFENNFKVFLNPINIISFIFGYTIFPISVIINVLILNKKRG